MTIRLYCFSMKIFLFLLLLTLVCSGNINAIESDWPFQIGTCADYFRLYALNIRSPKLVPLCFRWYYSRDFGEFQSIITIAPVPNSPSSVRLLSEREFYFLEIQFPCKRHFENRILNRSQFQRSYSQEDKNKLHDNIPWLWCGTSVWRVVVSRSKYSRYQSCRY